jgi:hypothetical protein
MLSAINQAGRQRIVRNSVQLAEHAAERVIALYEKLD